MNSLYLHVLFICYAVFYASAASANAGLPMLFIQWPAMVLLLLPIICIEAWIIQKQLQLGFARTFKVAGIANGVSTVVGIPITYALLLLLYALFFLAAGKTFGAWFESIISPPPFGPPNEFVVQYPVLAGAIVAVLVPFMIVGIPGLENMALAMVLTSGILLMVVFFFMSWKIEYYIARWLLKSDEPSSVLLNRAFKHANLASYLFLLLIWIVMAVAYIRP